MAKDVSDTLRDALGHVVRDAVKNMSGASPQKSKGGPMSGAKGVAAGAGLAAVAPLLAKKGVDAVRGGNGLPTPKLPTPKAGKLAGTAVSRAGDKAGSQLKDLASEKIDEAGGAGGLVKEAASGLLPSIGGDDGGSGGGMPGVGKGRRMPIQQAVDVAVPVETAYNQFSQFEDWPEFMHRVTNVSQDDPTSVEFSTKIWTRKREFKADIETQRPDERIKWRVSQGITHTGVVTFHELAPRLTRIEVNLDVDPGSLIEKAARGMRHIKRAVRADLHRFKAFIEMQELETGAWRGVIEDGELVEDHPEDYDEERDYSDIEDIKEEAEASGDHDEDEDKDEDEDEQRSNGHGDEESRKRFKQQAEASGSDESKSPPTPRPRRRPGRSRGEKETTKSSSGSRSSGSSRSSKSSRSGGSSRSGSSKSGGSSSRRKATSKS